MLIGALVLVLVGDRILGLRDLLNPDCDCGLPMYFSNASRAERIGLDDLPGAIGVMRSPDDHMPIGIAFPAGYIGGWAGIDFYRGKPEAVWRLQLGKEDVEGRWALRSGVFVELVESAE